MEYRWTSWEDLSAKEIRWLLQELQELRSQQNDSRANMETLHEEHALLSQQWSEWRDRLLAHRLHIVELSSELGLLRQKNED